MNETSRLLATTVVWTAVACTFIFGVFSKAWVGSSALLVQMFMVLAIAGAGAFATAAIWSFKFLHDPAPSEKKPGGK